MRKEIFRMEDAAARALMAAADVVHVATTAADGTPILRALNSVVMDGAVCFHAAPAGEKLAALGRAAVVGAEEVIASIPSYFLDPERACPATTLYRSAQAHGVVEEVSSLEKKARVLAALLAKYQPEGGHVPITAEHPLYTKALGGLLVFEVRLDRLDGKAKLAQNRTPAERVRLCEKLWERGAAGDPRAIEHILSANPDMPVPAFLQGPGGMRLCCAPGADDAPAAGALLDGAYWNDGFSVPDLAEAHTRSQAWVGARDAGGQLVASARAITDGKKHAWIYDVIVTPSLRGRGLGRAVVRLVLDHPAVRGARKLHLGTRDAQDLYRKLGFVDESEMPPKGYTSTTMHLDRATAPDSAHAA
jgi:nitroimidazol reductase NimA-like FMN-containing flavoprotein (pyridoxamine 5'-phosphate oxidase superfamily)/ribosomal protein S18 acetylase RimI-like enzyme